MIEPNSSDKDEVLEYAAQLIEDANFLDAGGIWAPRKRDREDAALRLVTAKEVRTRCAEHIRAMKSRRDLDAKQVLRRLADLPNDHRHDMHLTDAWALAWKGWVDILCIVKCNSNSVPPEAEYRIRITELGQNVLTQDKANDNPVQT